jgi:hypothetical protein
MNADAILLADPRAVSAAVGTRAQAWRWRHAFASAAARLHRW